MSFSELLKQCRKKQGISQAELASKLGVTQQAVGKWESGKSSPDPTTVARIAELLNTYFRNYTGPVSAEEMNLVTNNWPHGTASTDANVQYMGRIDKESDDAILNGNTDLDNAKTTDELAASSAN